MDPTYSIYSELNKLEESGQSGILCTIVFSKGSTPRREGSKMLVFPDGRTIGSIGGGELERRVITKALDSLKKRSAELLEFNLNEPEKGDPGLCGGQLTIFIDPILPRNKLVVVGGGHVGREVVDLAHWLGFHVTVCDDRPEFRNEANIPNADEHCSEGLPEITANTYVVLTTRDVDIDLIYLPDLLNSEAAYIGVIGSRKRWETTKTKLLDVGLSKEKIEKIHSPIGLALNAETPKEIALSIMAEVLMIQKHGHAKSMSR